MSEELKNKVIYFWNKYDKEAFTKENVKEYFTSLELAEIIKHGESNFHFIRGYELFVDKIKGIDNLFFQEEIKSFLKQDYPLDYFFKMANEDTLLSLLPTDNSLIHDNLSYYLTSDDERENIIKQVNDLDIKLDYITNMESDERKLQWLKKVSSYDRIRIINSLKNDEIREKFISFFSKGKANIIRRLSSDEKKEYYLRKYWNVLSSWDKEDIITSISDENKILSLLSHCNDNIKVQVAYKLIRRNKVNENIINQIRNNNKLYDLFRILHYDKENIPLVEKYMDRITNYKQRANIIIDMPDEYAIKYMDQLKDKEKCKLIKENIRYNLDYFNFLNKIENKEYIFDIINHCEKFPKYSENLEFIVDLYANKYNVNKNRLIELVSNTSLFILKNIESENILKLLNSSEESFKKILQLFNQDELKMNDSAMNDVLNSILQREFRINNSDIIIIFSTMIQAIDNNDKDTLVSKIEKINEIINIDDEIAKNNWTKSQFISLLLNKNLDAINLLHDITENYIKIKRNAFVQDNLLNEMEICTNVKYEKNGLMKAMFMSYPTELIKEFLPTQESLEYSNYYTPEEIQLIKNEELMNLIVDFKKYPKMYPEMPEEVKKNIRLFNSIFEKRVVSLHPDNFFCIEGVSKEYVFKEFDREYVANILMNIDINKLEKNLFADEEMYNKLLKMCNQYKICGWGKMFDASFSKAEIVLNEETIANFIQYFPAAYNSIKAKDINANVTLTSLLDHASCYSMESKIYSKIFGKDNYQYLASNPGPNASTMTKDKRLDNALKYMKTIRNRNKITVPPIDSDFALKSGKRINITVGNFSNPINLTYGERTGACMRIGGVGESLFSFCLENENGFHICFNNPENGKFVSRVSGFRNGNTVFLNQLRKSVDKTYDSKDLIEAVKLIADEIILQSKNSSIPIENVVISDGYVMKESNKICQDLQVKDIKCGMRKFYSDVCEDAIVLSTTAEADFVPLKLGNSNVPKYQVGRDKTKILYNNDALDYRIHLESLDQFLSGTSIDKIAVNLKKELYFCLSGEDWCVTVDAKGNLEDYIMKNTINKGQAMIELQQAKEYIKQNLDMEIEKSNGRRS